MGLREALMALPEDQLERSDLAVIVPAFELTRGRECGNFENCARMLCRLFSMIIRASLRIPNNKTELNECIKARKCSTFRPKEYLHISIFPPFCCFFI